MKLILFPFTFVITLLRDILSSIIGKILFWVLIVVLVHSGINFMISKSSNEPLSIGTAVGRTIVADYHLVKDNSQTIYSDLKKEF